MTKVMRAAAAAAAVVGMAAGGCKHAGKQSDAADCGCGGGAPVVQARGQACDGGNCGGGTGHAAGHGAGRDGRPTLQDRVNHLYDPCWPERYSYVARASVLQPFAAQANNGAILDQMLFNYHFEAGSDKLSPAGVEKLDYLSRRRPAPDRLVYLQTARDAAVYDPAAPEKVSAGRQELDGKRAQAVQKYLTVSTVGRPLAFDVQVIDPPDISFRAEGPANAARGYPGRFQSGLNGAVSNTQTGAGGGSIIVASPTAGGSAGGSTGAGTGPATGGGSAGAGGGTGGTGR